MVNEFKAWLSDNVNLYDTLVGQLEGEREYSRSLVIGKYSLIAGLIIKDKCPSVEAICNSEEFKSDFRYNTDQEACVPFVSDFDGEYDLIYSPLHLNDIPKSQAVSFLFDCFEHLKKGGIFILSFQDAMYPVVGESNEVEVWYNPELKHSWKVYTAEDLMDTLTAIGFSFKGIEECKPESLGRVVSIICTK